MVFIIQAMEHESKVNMLFDDKATKDEGAEREVDAFLNEIITREVEKGFPVVIHQDGRSKGYYIKCEIAAEVVCPLLDMDARLDPTSKDSFRANRVLLTKHNTYKRMVKDVKDGREFNDIIVEYTKDYSPRKPLKIWGGQHRAKAIQEAYQEVNISRSHGFKIFFSLSKEQRTEIALISNTNIAVSNDLFDRLQEETLVGDYIRNWCWQVGILKEGEDFPDRGSTSEKITVKLARTFITNFYLGKEKAENLKNQKLSLDKNIYEPYICESGVSLDEKYERIVHDFGDSIWDDSALLQTGEAFARLHKAQHSAVKESTKVRNRKSFRNKALILSVISAWAYVAGLLQGDTERLRNHYAIPKTNSRVPDPLNAQVMSEYHHHDSDDPTYRGLGARSSLKDRQRMVQLFLARSLDEKTVIDKKLMDKAVSQVVGITSFQKGYTS
jgi:hypothetical protein